MLTINKNLTALGQELVLDGQMDETVNLQELVGAVPAGARLRVRADKVSKINSSGVKTWINYFETLKTQGVTVIFTHLSIVLVEQLNSLTNFCAGFPVEQMAVPFACTNRACKKETVLLLKTAELKTQVAGGEIVPVKCPHCQSASVFDDFVEEYFACLEYTQ